MKLITALVCLSAFLFAQPETATLRGTVTDTAGLPVPGIIVRVTGTGPVEREAKTGTAGTYSLPFLSPGTYQLVVERLGYQVFVGDEITLAPGEVRRVDPTVETGPPQDAAPVSLAKPAPPQHGTLRTAIASSGPAHDAPAVDKLPSPARLAVQAPGVQGNGTGLTISGLSQRERQTWMADGVADDATGAYQVNPLFFESLSVISANPGPETYRAGGVDIVSKHGSNEFHGLLYYKGISSAADGKPYFQTTRQRYAQHEFFGEAGGAIFKNSTFFYGGWMHQSNRYTQQLFASVPTAQMRTGDFSQYLNAATAPGGRVTILRDPRTGQPFANNTIIGNRISAVSNNILGNYLPQPNVGDANTFVDNYTWDHRFGEGPVRSDWPMLRLDQKTPAGGNLYVRFMDAATSTVAPGTAGNILSSTQASHYKSYAVAHAQGLPGGVVNQLRAGYTVLHARQGLEVGDVTPLRGDQVLGTTGLQGSNLYGYSVAGFPAVSITGLADLSMRYPGARDNNLAARNEVWTADDSISWWHGRHSFRLGGQFASYRWFDGSVPQEAYGSFTFTGQFTGIPFGDFLLGLPATSSRLLNPKVDSMLRQRQGGLYAADSIRVTPRLTVDLGLRWDYFGSPRNDDGFMYNWDPATGAVIVAPGTLTSVSPLFPKGITVRTGQVVPDARLTNLRPRVSAAYRVSDRIVVRGGYGEFTDSGLFGAGGRVNDSNGPYRISETYFNSIVSGTAQLTFPKPFPTTASYSGSPNVTAIPLESREGVIRQYNATVERAAASYAVRLSYIGSRGTGLNYRVDINKPRASMTVFTTARLPFPLLGSAYETRTDGEWRYDSAQAEMRKRAGAVTFDASFNWANNRSNYANTYDPYTVTEHWSNDAATRRMYFRAGAEWLLPFDAKSRLLGNWTLRAMGVAGSGQYYSPLFTGADPANASRGFVTALADCVSDPDSGAGTISQWFNPAAFAVPSATAGRYGTCALNSLKGYPIHVVHASLAKRLRLSELFTATLTVQVSNLANTAHFAFPNANITTPGAGQFTAASQVGSLSPERQGPRQVDFKFRVEW
jgi:hypothetical protein